MVRLTDLLLMARRAGEKPTWQRINRHYRYVMSRPWTIQAQIANLPGRDRKKVQVEPIRNWKFFKGDLVHILKGKDTGRQGIISDIIRQRNWVIVEGLNCHYRYIGRMPGYDGTYVASEAPLNVRDVALVDPSDNQPADVDFRFTEAGDKVRVSKRTGRIVPIPQTNEHKDFKTRESYIEQPKDTVAEEVCKKTYTPSLKTVEEELMEANNITETRTPAKTYWY
ncbi:probable 39S ribosomal protein L24, mitochondrial [Patiria miniata]|uniref:Large ribosomal subunit protein uL24m n=1 Tax=Patiria miniata TaxID=46514 RepID=A0A914BT02_PATMI|nr:probable 39S ribosomal protein L24, mitochondrial [Patiria miniata]XP_038078732.1 probable 39S ribosomal protein L24, mitochondrial [Patiria miniata]XP_038078733.1 probable 39S ribosomal protein L24, mitochondrial [Patiria miniata]